MRSVSVSLFSLFISFCSVSALQLSRKGERGVQVEFVPYTITDFHGEEILHVFRDDKPRSFFQATINLDAEKLFKNYGLTADFDIIQDFQYTEEVQSQPEFQEFVMKVAQGVKKSVLQRRAMASLAFIIDNKLANWDFKDTLNQKFKEMSGYRKVVQLLKEDGFSLTLPTEPPMHEVELIRLNVDFGTSSPIPTVWVADTKTVELPNPPHGTEELFDLTKQLMHPEGFRTFVPSPAELVKKDGLAHGVPAMALKVDGKSTEPLGLLFNMNELSVKQGVSSGLAPGMIRVDTANREFWRMVEKNQNLAKLLAVDVDFATSSE
uniref:Uncharacterized protein n=1 Tax=Chromera velia CCMP2878 TaxID=1169474 RepID=A0A0G4I9E6_9ALVE|eukprot:Cvel_12112.t1-p1 / transcript=Cvel_12112.t1 / gene=Cvel_12112 / organism=Chromera_velia_CCMP2878 / gene_product=hypothetical protein / transcript_product=hypothetical protein / location=Cvel_scaffold780:35275-36234(+) / protein_length=320 / sequence_SO=supercontig / SO=protein_coding / is_pseudo=false